jgi:hypothetical protein
MATSVDAMPNTLPIRDLASNIMSDGVERRQLRYIKYNTPIFRPPSRPELLYLHDTLSRDCLFAYSNSRLSTYHPDHKQLSILGLLSWCSHEASW